MYEFKQCNDGKIEYAPKIGKLANKVDQLDDNLNQALPTDQEFIEQDGIFLFNAMMKEMTDQIGVESIDQLIDEAIPSAIRKDKRLDLPVALNEFEYLKNVKAIA